MSRKVGRPRVPKAKQKAVLYGARVPAEQAPTIDRNLDAMGETPSRLIRETLENVFRLQWSVCHKWRQTELHNKRVAFKFAPDPKQPQRVLYGQGLFWVLQNRFDPAKIAVEIQIRQQDGPGMRVLRLSVPQALVDRIEQHPDPAVADFRLEVDT